MHRRKLQIKSFKWQHMENKDNKSLTQWSKGSGCGCKIAPGVLSQILACEDQLPPHPGLITSSANNEDAAVMQWDDDDCLVATTDFFTPVLDDPYAFGKIAASNAISDVYAMGGDPVLALGILGWPIDKIAPAMAQQVLDGARMVCRMAGIPLAGGHSIESTEPIFGLAVNGRVHRNHLKQNTTAQSGDLLFITKPLGVGMVLAAAKRGLVDAADYDIAVHQMIELNRVGSALGRLSGVAAMTDITGFGLLGHLLEMTDSGRLTAIVDFAEVPQMKSNAKWIAGAVYPDMTMKNYSVFAAHTSVLSMEQLLVLCDPQTSGGLMVAVSPSSLDAYLAVIRDFGLQGIADRCIGRFVEASEKRVEVR